MERNETLCAFVLLGRDNGFMPNWHAELQEEKSRTQDSPSDYINLHGTAKTLGSARYFVEGEEVVRSQKETSGTGGSPF
jgi:hypothetical protein